MLAVTELGTRAVSWFHIAAASDLYVERGFLAALCSETWHLGDADRLFAQPNNRCEVKDKKKKPPCGGF
jgi:hypothetical protein